MDQLNLAEHLLAQNARERPDHPALVFLDEDGEFFRSTYSECQERILLMAAVLERHGRRGDRVIVALAHGPNYALAFFAAIAAGMVAVPISPMLARPELMAIVEDTEASCILLEENDSNPGIAPFCRVITSGDLHRSSTPTVFARTTAEDPAFLIYTSGTGGNPRGVLHAQRVILGRKPMLAWTDLTSNDRLLHAGQLNWSYSLGVGVMDPWSVGATAVLFSSNGAGMQPSEWMPCIDRNNITIFATVPSLYRRIVKYTDWDRVRLDRLRHVLSAGEALRADLRKQWLDLAQTPIYEALGMSEISTYISSGPHVPVKPGSPGKPQSGRRVCILDRESDAPRILPDNEVGLLAVHRSDPGLMLGYWNATQADEAERFRGEWFVGGDLASQDSESYVHFHGRADDVMNASGYRVSPHEVERCLGEHEYVHDVGVRDLLRANDVRIIAAFVVPSEKGQEIPEEDRIKTILSYARTQLATYKLPREVFFVADLPRTHNGKLQRCLLRAP